MFDSIAAMQDAVGTELGVGEWIDITQEKIDAFAVLTQDEQWVHVDVARAEASPIGSTIAHGYFTLSLLAPTVMALTEVRGASQYLNYGMNRVRFPSAVRSGSRTRSRLMLKSVEPTKRGYLVTVEATVDVDGQERPACVAEVLTLIEMS